MEFNELLYCTKSTRVGASIFNISHDTLFNSKTAPTQHPKVKSKADYFPGGRGLHFFRMAVDIRTE